MSGKLALEIAIWRPYIHEGPANLLVLSHSRASGSEREREKGRKENERGVKRRLYHVVESVTWHVTQ